MFTRVIEKYYKGRWWRDWEEKGNKRNKRNVVPALFQKTEDVGIVFVIL